MESLSLTNCCDLFKDDKIFKNKCIISELDFFSSLPDDCLISIFSFLNHNDLDIISHVSQKMRNFGIHARPQTRKHPARDLKVYRNLKGDICVDLSGIYITDKTGNLGQYDGRKHFIRLKSRDDELEEIVTYAAYHPRDLDDYYRYHKYRGRVNLVNFNCGVFERIRYLTDRFSIKHLNLFMSSIMIDRHFALHCEYAFNFPSMQYIKVEVEDKLDLIYHRKFVNWIASMKPYQLEITAELFNKAEVETEFVEILALNVNCKEFKLYIDYSNWMYKIPHFLLPVSLDRYIAKFQTFGFPCFLIELERLMEIFLERLELPQHGHLELSLTKPIDRSVVRAALNPRKFRENSRGFWEIVSADRKYYADFIIREEKGFLQVFVKFSTFTPELEQCC